MEKDYRGKFLTIRYIDQIEEEKLKDIAYSLEELLPKDIFFNLYTSSDDILLYRALIINFILQGSHSIDNDFINFYVETDTSKRILYKNKPSGSFYILFQGFNLHFYSLSLLKI